MNKEELKKRTKKFALRIIKLADALPNTPAGRTIANQIVRSGTSVAANYRASCRGRSMAEFISKLGNVVEETDESAFWLELIVDAKLMTKQRVSPLLNEANELTAIFTSSIITAKNNIKNKKKQNQKSKI